MATLLFATLCTRAARTLPGECANFRDENITCKSLIVLMAAGLAACAAAPEAPARGTGPPEAWALSTPEAEGLDGAAIAALTAEFASGARGQITGMLARRGKIVFENSAHDFDRPFERRDPARGPYDYYDPDFHPFYQHGRLHSMHSVSKSVTSALIGIAIRTLGFVKQQQKIRRPNTVKNSYHKQRA